MADILIDVEVKGQNSVTSAVKGISTLQNNVKLLSNAFKSGGLSQRQYYKGIKQLADASKKSEKELRKYANTLRAEERETKKAAAAAKAYASARREALEMDRRLTAEKLKSANAARMQASEEERLKSKFVQGHTAMNIYSKELNDLSIARKMDIISAEQQKQAVLELNVAMKNGTGVFGGYSGGMQGAIKKTSRMGVVAQQTGYQVGDFLVQIQSGANPMMAFGQQATQLVGVMGLFEGKMVLAGAALGIIIPLVTAVAAYFWAASKAAKEAADKTASTTDEIKDLESALRSLANVSKSSAGDIKAYLTDTFGELGDEVQALIEDLREAEFTIISNKMQREVESLTTDLTRLGGAFEVFWQDFADPGSVDSGYLEQTKDLIKQAGIAYKDFVVLEEAMKGVFSARSTNEFIEALVEARTIAKDIGGPTGDAVVDALLKAAEKAGLLNRVLNDASGAAEDLSTVSERLSKILETMSIDNILAQMDMLNTKLGTAIFNGGKFMSVIGSRLSSVWGAMEDAAASIERGRLVGRGRGLGPGGPTSAELQNSDFRVQLANQANWTPPKTKDAKGSKQQVSAAEEAEDYLRKLTLENELKRKSIGLSEEAARILEITAELEKKKQPIDKERIALIAKEEMATQALIEKNKEYLSYVEATGEQFRAFGESLIDGTTSIEDAFKGLLNNILKSIWDKMVGDPLADLGEKVGSFIFKSVFGSANGNVFSNGSHVQAFANGGVVGGPTMFPMNGGKTGLMGEAGPEAIMPLKRGANGKLGVQMEGGGATQVTQVFNINGNGDEYIMGKIKQAAPAIQEATKASIVQDRRRGGTMKQAFRG